MSSPFAVLLKFILLIAFLCAILLAFVDSYLYNWPTGDEYWHFNYSRRMLDEGVIERESVHNYNSTTPFVLLNAFVSDQATRLGISSGFDKVIARLPAVGWYMLLLVLSYCSAAYLFKDSDSLHSRAIDRVVPIACWSALLTCLDQTLLGQGSHIGSDIPFAAMTLLFLMALENYRRAPGIKGAAFVGSVIALAFNVKYSSSFLLLFALVYLPVVYIHRQRHSGARVPQIGLGLLGQFLLIFGLITFIVDAAYGFREIGLGFSTKEWYAAPFKLLASLIPNVPLPWPIPFIAGFDHQIAAERTWSWNSILLGHLYPNGSCYYFPLIWLLKTPLALLSLVFLGVALALARVRELKQNKSFVLVLSLFCYLLLYFCFIFRTQVGIRYVLMCLPLGYLLLGYVISTGLKQSEQALLAVFVVLGTAYEALPYVGNSLAFTNGIVADKSTAYQWIADSNIDWYQNYDQAKTAASGKLGSYTFNPPHLVEGNNVFSINKLAGVMHNFPQYEWIRTNLSPSGNFGYTLISFSVDRKLFDRFLNESRTYPPPPSTADICPPDRQYRPIRNGVAPVLSGSWEDQQLYTACLKVTEPTEIELTIITGRGEFGSYPNELNCLGTEAGPGDSLWFKLPPGVHPICAKIMVSAQARWKIHQGKAELALRNQ